MMLRAIAQKLRLTPKNHTRGFTDYSLANQLGFLDPYIILSDFKMSQAYFPPHPHAGFSVITYLFQDSEGAFINRDSFGDHSRIEAGALHWTQAGRGIQHEEIPEQEGLVCHGLQMWINHADQDRLAEPTRFHVDSDKIPEVKPAVGVRLRVLVGEAFGVKAAFQPLTSIHFLDVYLDSGAVLTYPTTDETALLMLITGTAQVDNQQLDAHDVITFKKEGDTLKIQGGKGGCQFLLGTGQPFHEPIIYGGPFVMTTPEQLAAAKQHFGRGDMGTLAPSPIFSVI